MTHDSTLRMRRFIDAVRIDEAAALSERVERHPYRDYVGNEIMLTLVWNPTVRQLTNLVHRAVDQVVRCLVVGDDIVVWDAHYVEHTDVAKLLGIARANGRLGYGEFYEHEGAMVFHGGRGGDHPFYAANPALARLFASGVEPKRYAILR